MKETKKVVTTVETSGDITMTGRELIDMMRLSGVRLPLEDEVQFDIAAKFPGGPAWDARQTHISLDMGTLVIGWKKREQKTE